ncbi:hypothetical protein K439DRAFT_1506874 [Ramaria rubella]|nr:hypothetical protein K439DRAFT_1506874 [Ramaria rubella]
MGGATTTPEVDTSGVAVSPSSTATTAPSLGHTTAPTMCGCVATVVTAPMGAVTINSSTAPSLGQWYCPNDGSGATTSEVLSPDSTTAPSLGQHGCCPNDGGGGGGAWRCTIGACCTNGSGCHCGWCCHGDAMAAKL